MILHGKHYSINFQLFSQIEITENYFTPATSVIGIPIMWNEFYDLISGQSLKLPVLYDKKFEFYDLLIIHNG